MGRELVITYLLWLLLGWFGVHHFYLGRDRQAFVWFALFGGYFGIGWFTDIWRIPSYVREATNNKSYVQKLKEKQKKHPKPPFSLSNFLGQLAFANTLGYLLLAAIPEELVEGTCLKDAGYYLLPFAISIGIHTVGNFGHQEGGFKWTLIGASSLLPLKSFIPNIVSWSSILSGIAFHFKEKKWRAAKGKRRLTTRIAILALCTICYLGLFTSYLYFNAEIHDKNGDTIKMRDAVSNFFKSPIWLEFKDSLMELYNVVKAEGWSKLFRELVDKFDPHGEQNALKVLELKSNATQEEIHARYKKLSREWHPDRFKTYEEKQEASEKFIVIQTAYETLSVIKQRRKAKNQQQETT